MKYLTALGRALAAPFVGFWSLLKNEPVGAQGVVQTGIALGTAFGLGWTAAQIAATLAFSQSVLTFLTRAAVTPNPDVKEQVAVALATPVPTPVRPPPPVDHQPA